MEDSYTFAGTLQPGTRAWSSDSCSQLERTKHRGSKRAGPLGTLKAAMVYLADACSNGGAPSNWLSRFGGSAWQWDEHTEQYYYHSFLLEQPDLNWRNPEVRQAMADVMRFWLRRGVDGFRIDASAVLAEDALLRDDPPNAQFGKDTPPPKRLKRVFTDDRPESMSYSKRCGRS